MRKAGGIRKLSAVLAQVRTAWVMLSVCVLSWVARAEDQALPHGPYSDEIEHFQGRIDGIADFSVFSVDDVTLKVAYKRVFQCIVGDEFHSNEPETVAAFADLKRRGSTATPMLLKLMRENQENQLESSILSGITGVDIIDPQPFVDYARNLLRERTATMNAFLAGHAARLLQKRGSSEDLELLRWVVEKRPFVAASVKPSIRALDLRLAAEKELDARPINENRDAGEAGTNRGDTSGERADTGSVSERNASARWVAPALGLLTAILLTGAAAKVWLRSGKTRA